MDDLDKLMKEASATQNKDMAIEVCNRIFSFNNWCAVAMGEEKNWRPFVGVENGIPTLFVFTDPDRARQFAINNKIIQANDTQSSSLQLPVKGLADMADNYLRDGIRRIVINLLWEIPFEQLKSMYYHYVKPYNFKELTEKAKTSIEGIIEFWDALTGLPHWFFVGNMRKGEVFLHGKNKNYVVVFLDHESAMKVVNNVKTQNPQLQWGPIPMSPKDALDFINQNTQSGGIIGMIYTDATVFEGMETNKINEMNALVNDVKSRKNNRPEQGVG